jgi:hypothetical protein
LIFSAATPFFRRRRFAFVFRRGGIMRSTRYIVRRSTSGFFVSPFLEEPSHGPGGRDSTARGIPASPLIQKAGSALPSAFGSSKPIHHRPKNPVVP